MPRPLKIVFHNTVLFITSSVEEGFMFPANPLIEVILRCCLAKAQLLHPLEICHFLVEPTHIHMIVKVTNPDDVRGFMERFKTESAHAINRLLGRKKRTIWCAGYDSPVLITIDDVIREICYTYLNPSKDNLADSVQSYVGFSSWKAFQSGNTSFAARIFARDDVEELPIMNERTYHAAAGRLLRMGKKAAFTISPNAWMECFGITSPEDIRDLNRRIVERIARGEQEYRAARAAKGQSLLSRESQVTQRINAPYIPNRDGRRSYCVSANESLRKQFLRAVEDLISRGREVLLEWRKGNFIPYTLGLYPPSFPKLAELYSR